MTKQKTEAIIYIPFNKIQGIGFIATLKIIIKNFLKKDKSFILKGSQTVKKGFFSESISGPTTFMKNLKKYLDNTGFSYFKSPKHAKLTFFPNILSKKILAAHKKRGGKVIQRLDGIHYPSKHQEKYIQLNKDIKDIYQNYSDHIIFQSEHSKDQCFALFEKKEKDQYSVIHNGVDKSIFYPERTSISAKQGTIKFITTGSFRNVDMVEPIIKALDQLKDEIDFEYMLIGPIKNKDIFPLIEIDYLTHFCEKDQKKLANLLRESDIFIYSFLNPPCPNSVLEAVSCGVPIVGFDSGAMSELLFFSKDLLAPVSNEVFQKYEDFNPEKLADKILLTVNNYKYFKKKAMENSHLYSFEDCGKKYLEVFQKLALSTNKHNER